MSFVEDQIRRIDGQLDRIQLSAANVATTTTTSEVRTEASEHLDLLQSLVKSLSISPSSRTPLLSERQIKRYLEQARSGQQEASASAHGEHAPHTEYQQELEWLLASKATAQVYGLVLNKLLEETVTLSDDIWYWDEVLSSRLYTALYSVQMSPFRLFDWSSSVWDDARRRASQLNISTAGHQAQQTLSTQWKEFYGLVRQVVQERNVAEMHKRVIGPVQRIRGEVRHRQTNLKKARLRGANALGVLLGEGLMNESVHGEGLATPSGDHASHKWKVSVARNVALMDAVLAKVNEPSLAVEKFDAAIAQETDEDPLYEADIRNQSDDRGVHPALVIERLIRTINERLPEYRESTKAIVKDHGRPSRLARYWLPVTVGILSSTTILRILVNRKAEIREWIEDLGSTIMDFWINWVLEPTKKVISTIHHDEGSEVSIMSKRSLEGDRDSLERMVVDFAIDNPGNATDTGNPLTDTEIADIRSKIREGDLTPVLKAYEKDLASPFYGTIRGNLIRALLIQVQKTKVDVEVAMGGIDALLKSQELVFGFVGLTPGILVTVGAYFWLRNSFSRRRGLTKAQKQGLMVRQLRNIDRVLTNSTPTEFGELYYKDHGLLLCEVHVLRQQAKKSMPDQVHREFIEDLDELVDVRTGVKKQIRVVERIRWSYMKWF